MHAQADSKITSQEHPGPIQPPKTFQNRDVIRYTRYSVRTLTRLFSV